MNINEIDKLIKNVNNNDKRVLYISSNEILNSYDTIDYLLHSDKYISVVESMGNSLKMAQNALIVCNELCKYFDIKDSISTDKLVTKTVDDAFEKFSGYHNDTKGEDEHNE